jgi:hypothetical protein
LPDNWNSTLGEFGSGLDAFWGADPRKAIAARKTAAYCLMLPTKECTQQIAWAVEAAARMGLVVFDDNYGSCFLPDGNILPEDMKAIWESDLAEMRDDAAKPGRQKTDGRNFWERIGGELFDALGRGNKSR